MRYLVLGCAALFGFGFLGWNQGKRGLALDLTTPEGREIILGLADKAKGVPGSLSGGQRQRIAIARAVIRDTPILILDEPTVGLDAASEQSVIEALDKLMKGRTSVVIAHHLGTIRQADVIFVLKDCELVEQGTHEALLAKNGVYAELHRIQTPEGAKLTPGQPVAS